jgi:hypothetical protein
MSTAPKTTHLEIGHVQVFSLGDIKLHAYSTNDPLGDVVYLLEKNGLGIVLEQPNFVDSIKAFEKYIKSLNIDIKGVIPAYHMPGKFLVDVPRYTTKTADDYARKGRGQQAAANFAQTFNGKFDDTLVKTNHIIKGDTLTIAGIDLLVLPNAEAFDLVIPEIKALYIHMLGHDTHSIIESVAQASGMIQTLQDHLKNEYELILTSHHAPETAADVLLKIDYLKDLVLTESKAKNKDDFIDKMRMAYPECKKEDYLEMTAGMLFK